jgi:hypothetical protein
MPGSVKSRGPVVPTKVIIFYLATLCGPLWLGPGPPLKLACLSNKM